MDQDFIQPKIAVGAPAPTFELMAYQNDEFKSVKLEDYKGKWVVLFFYPADFTFVCPTELGDLADNYAKFQEMNVEILAISTDSQFCHKAWHDSSESIKKITYPMLSDRTGEVSWSYGVLIEEAHETHRGTFIIDPEGSLRSFEVNHDQIGRSIAELMRKLQVAQFVHSNDGTVCPMNWKPGDDPLKPGMDLVGKI